MGLLQAQVGINTENPDPNSLLEIQSTNKGVLFPRLTMEQREALNLGANSNGLTVYNVTTNCYSIWNAIDQVWSEICPAELGLVDFSNCDLIKVIGVYDMDKPVSSQDVRIDVPVKVTKLGKYNYTATCNNVTFIAAGTFVNMGPQTISLYVDSRGGSPASTGTFPATVIIGPIGGNPTTTAVCNNVPVKFINRSSSILKILNIGGNQNSTGLVSSGSNYSSSTVYANVGAWLTSGAGFTVNGVTAPPALTYSGTSAIQVVNVSLTSIALLQKELDGASIVWMGASEGFSNGFAQVLAEWYKAGKGILMITGDKIAESAVADACGYYIEDGSAAAGSTWGARLPQVFSSAAPYNAPFNVGNGLSLGYSGSNCGYITSNRGLIFMTVTSSLYPSAFADIDNDIFIFGDKFGAVGAGATWNNFAWVLTDIFAWSLKNAPIY